MAADDTPESDPSATEQPPQSLTSDRFTVLHKTLKTALRDDNLEAIHQALRDGADPNHGRFSAAFERARSKEAITVLYRHGARVDKLKTSAPARLLLVGLSGDDLGTSESKLDPLSRITNAQFKEGRARRFGTTNPERMDIPFWRAMVEAHCWAYDAREKFVTEPKDGDETKTPQNYFGNPIWCFDRFGHSLTELPDGTFVQIGGEHEDYYDPDFMIYNDVVVHHPNSTAKSPKFDIYGYPENVFRPTDFHTATYVPEHQAIYIIGNNGYIKEEEKAMIERGETPVYRLDVGTWSVRAVTTQGEGPGFCYRHCAELIGNEIVIRPDPNAYKNADDKYLRVKRQIIKDGETSHVEVGVTEEWTLSLENLTWNQKAGI